jgi:hypothetical protein
VTLSRADEPELIHLRERLSSMQSLLVLSMLMTESGNEDHLLDLVATSVPSLGRGHLDGVFLKDSGWRVTTGACSIVETRAGVERQFEPFATASGAVTITDEQWSWAFSLRSAGSHFGYMVVGAANEPPDDEQFLLRVLAQHAGNALGNYRLHAQERETASQLQAVNDDLAATVAALEHSRAIHDRLTRVFLADEGQAGLARAIHEVTGFPVIIEDRHGNVRAWSGTGPDPPDAMSHRDPAARERALQQVDRDGRPFRDGDRVYAVANPHPDVFGVLVLVDPDAQAGAAEMSALEHGATVLAVELARLRRVADADVQVSRGLLEELLLGTTDEPAALARDQGLHALQEDHRVVVVRNFAGNAEVFFDAVRRAARDLAMGFLLVALAGTVVVLGDGEQQWEEFRLAVIREVGGGRCRIGVGGVCSGPAEVARSYGEARLALQLADAIGAPDGVTLYDDLGVYRVLAQQGDASTVEHFARDWLGALLEYDERRHADLVATLIAYVEHGRNQDSAATSLGIHKNTLKYRLQRIAELSGHNLSNPDTMFNLQLATRAWQTSQALRGPPPPRS